MLETKSVKVKSNEEQSMIDEMTRWGWTVKNREHVYSKDSHLEEKHGDLYSVTETLDYVNLIFERDLANPGVQKLKALKEKYDSVQGTYSGLNVGNEPTKGFIPGICIAAAGILITVLGANVGFLVVGIVAGGAFIAFKYSRYDKKHKEWEEKDAEFTRFHDKKEAQLNEILAEAEHIRHTL